MQTGYQTAQPGETEIPFEGYVLDARIPALEEPARNCQSSSVEGRRGGRLKRFLAHDTARWRRA